MHLLSHPNRPRVTLRMADAYRYLASIVPFQGSGGVTVRRAALGVSAGFTLIELLVVISIIGLLASVVISSLNGARAKAKDARRLADMRAIQQALELYNTSTNTYPAVAGWRSQCAAWGNLAADQVIPGLVPQYMPAFPSDPDMVAASNSCCYLYYSNGTDYKLLNICTNHQASSPNTIIDPRRDGGASNCTIDGATLTNWALFTAGGCAW